MSTNAAEDPAQDLARECADALWATDRASQALGMRIESVAPGRAIVSMTVRAEMIGPGGVCSRGAIFLLADTAMAFASNTYGQCAVAQYCDIMFDNPVEVGEELVAAASERHRSERKAVYDVRVQTRVGQVAAEMRGHTHTLSERILKSDRRPKP